MWPRLAARKRPPCVAPLGSPSARAARSRAPRACRREAPASSGFFSRNGRTFGSPRRAPSARVRLERRARVQGGSLDDFSRPSLPGFPRVAGPKPRHSSSRGFVFRRFARVQKKSVEGDASVRNQCAKSENRENEHPFAKKMTVNHWKKRYAFDKIVQPFFGHFSGVSDHRSLIIGRVAIRGVFRFSRICRDLVRDLPRTHLNARVHRDRDVHPLTRP